MQTFSFSIETKGGENRHDRVVASDGESGPHKSKYEK